jgi:hypothetical protein
MRALQLGLLALALASLVSLLHSASAVFVPPPGFSQPAGVCSQSAS